MSKQVDPQDVEIVTGKQKKPLFEEHAVFYPQATELRAALLNQVHNNDANSPCPYYGFEPSGLASLLLNPGSPSCNRELADFMEWLVDWSSDELDCTQISKPQARVLLTGEARFREPAAKDRYHFVLALGPENARYSGYMQVIRPSSQETLVKTNRRAQTEEVLLGFNRFIFHNGDAEYVLKALRQTFDPADALLLVEGYVW